MWQGVEWFSYHEKALLILLMGAEDSHEDDPRPLLYTQMAEEMLRELVDEEGDVYDP